MMIDGGVGRYLEFPGAKKQRGLLCSLKDAYSKNSKRSVCSQSHRAKIAANRRVNLSPGLNALAN